MGLLGAQQYSLKSRTEEKATQEDEQSEPSFKVGMNVAGHRDRPFPPPHPNPMPERRVMC